MQNWHKKFFLGLGLLTILVGNGLSAEWVITEDDLFAEIDTVSGVTHLQQDLQQVPAAVTIIDRRTIESSTAVDLVDIFRFVPGFQVYFHHANKPGVAYHAPGGEYSRRLEVKIDGRSVYEPLLSSVEWNTLGLELDDIEYIEVVRGSNTAADGTNAFLATINFVTRSPLAASGTSFRQKVGSNGLKSSAISHSAQFGQFATRGVIRASENDGHSDNGDFADTLVMRYQGLWTPTVADTISFQVGMGDTETIIELIDQDDPEEKPYERHWKSNYQHLEWKRIVSDWSDIELSIYHNAIDFEDEDWGATVKDVAESPMLDLSVTVRDTLLNYPDNDKKYIIKPSYAHFSDRWDAAIRSNIYRTDDFRMSLGLASRQDTLRSELFLRDTGKAKQTSDRAYANAEWTASDNLVLNYGQVIEKRKNKASTNSYRIAANYELSKQHIVRIASSDSYREPTLLEENQFSAYYFDAQPIAVNVMADEEIEKERLISREIGYLGSFLDDSLSLDVRIFEENLSNLIGERREPYIGVTQNKVNIIDNIIDTYNLGGLEWQLQYKPSNRLIVNLNHSYIRAKGNSLYRTFKGLDDPELDMAVCELNGYDEICDLKDTVPSHMINLLISYKMAGGIKLSGSYHSKSGFKSGIRDLSVPSSDSHIDLKASKRWQHGSHWLELSLSAQNAGSDYSEHYGFNNFERKYVLGFKLGSY